MKRDRVFSFLTSAPFRKAMMVLLCFWLIIVSFSFSPSPEKEQIRWQSPSQLTADDFRKPKAGRKVKMKTGRRTYRILEGYIHSGIAFSYVANGNKIEYEVYAFMLPDESWLADKENRATLQHEQAHFNISEIHARKLREKLSHIRKPEAAKQEYLRVMKELARVQAGFDRDHDGETGVTDHWQLKIMEALNERVAFSSSKIVQVRDR